MPCQVLIRRVTQSGVPGPGTAVSGLLNRDVVERVLVLRLRDPEAVRRLVPNAERERPPRRLQPVQSPGS